MSKLLELADAYAGAKFIDALNGKYEGEIAIARAALANNGKKLQAYRKAWVEQLIKEFEA